MKKLIFAVALTLLATLSNATAQTSSTGSAATSSSPAVAPQPAGRRNIVLPPAKANPVAVPKFDQPPTIDGRLD
ncbi:MAG TPA: hypothetical protein VK619_02290, partial [Pyrinomonadaceae bacterium]|nr:hypothetical protein [Pyrinomonadaceae bacterium]